MSSTVVLETGPLPRDPRSLLALRVLSWILVFASIALIAINIPLFYQYVIDGVQKSETLTRTGIPPELIALIRSVVRRFAELCFVGLSVALLLRSRETVAIVLAMGWALLGASISGSYVEVAAQYPNLKLFTMTVAALSSALAALILYVMPEGVFYFSWSRPLVIIFAVLDAIRIYIQTNSGFSLLGALLFLPFAVVFIIGIYVQRRRYRQADSIYQHQLKWVVFGATIAVMGIITGQLCYVVVPRDFHILTAGIDEIGGLVLALCMIFAITRYQLYNINVYIHRSVLYGTMIAVLIILFALVWLPLDMLFQHNRLLSFGIPLLVTVLSYRRARRLTQRVIDQNLYGFRFDLIQLAEGSQIAIQHQNLGVYSGHQIGGYHLHELIGKGGMAEVYRGEAHHLEVAVKLLPPDAAADLTARKRLRHEMQLLSQFDHPNIVKFHDYGQQASLHYLAIEYIDGRDLQSLLHERGRLPLSDVRWIIQDIAHALEVIHAQGIVHRDVKPSNIVLRPLKKEGYQAVLIDFGVAHTVSSVTTMTGMYAIGTINYMSPEQIQRAVQIDHRADIYALGVVAYEMVTGELPFDGNNTEVLFAHMHQPPPDPRQRTPTLPINMAIAIMRALSKNPDDRFDNVGQFAHMMQLS